MTVSDGNIPAKKKKRGGEEEREREKKSRSTAMISRSSGIFQLFLHAASAAEAPTDWSDSSTQ
jgi:hypothetical protein